MGKNHSRKKATVLCVDCGEAVPPAALSRYGRCPKCRVDRMLRAVAGRNEPPVSITPEDREATARLLAAEACNA